MVEALRELKERSDTRINALQAENQDLRRELAELRAELAALGREWRK